MTASPWVVVDKAFVHELRDAIGVERFQQEEHLRMCFGGGTFTVTTWSIDGVSAVVVREGREDREYKVNSEHPLIAPRLASKGSAS